MDGSDGRKLQLVPPSGAAPEQARPARLAAVLGGSCPACRQGRIFASFWRIRTECPRCRLRFAREAGYYTGAMYVSYALAVPLFAVLGLLVWLLFPQWTIEWILAAALLPFVPVAPLLFRASRILWIHFDRAIDPGEADGR